MDRHHDLLSDLERAALLRLQLLSPLDIREQYPLRLRGVEQEFEECFPDAIGTIEIAEELKLRHPVLSAQDARVMTTDFLVDMSTGQRLAVYVKYSKDLLNERKQQLLKIESHYWSVRGTRMTVFTEKDVNNVELGNLLMFASSSYSRDGSVTLSFLRQVAAHAVHQPMTRVLTDLACQESASYTDLVDRVKWACATGRLRLDLTERKLVWSDIWPALTVDVTDSQDDGFHDCIHDHDQ